MRSDTVPLFFPCARNRERRVARCPSACRDRKSTRLNSSHSQISYAVFCLKKKKEPRCRLARRGLQDFRAAAVHPDDTALGRVTGALHVFYRSSKRADGRCAPLLQGSTDRG